VNVLLAKTLSEMGQKVLLVDADLRKPQMHTRLGLNNLSGLSNLLAEDNQQWSDVVQSVPGYDNWSVITAGRQPPDPTRLLSSKRMHDLVQELAHGGNFDLVLFDTPPVLGLADAALVAEHCDGLMLLVSLGRVDRGLPKESIARIQSSGAPLLGLVTNAIKQEQQGNGYGYGYGKYGNYRYGYGGYGYGGYGYAAYNTSAAYAHYAAPDDSDSSTPGKGGAPSDSKTSWRQTIRRRRSQFLRWIDS
jgi:capsular exopolysaccharide synthesis family protein